MVAVHWTPGGNIHVAAGQATVSHDERINTKIESRIVLCSDTKEHTSDTSTNNSAQDNLFPPKPRPKDSRACELPPNASPASISTGTPPLPARPSTQLVL